jgi:hypothetical protein
LFWGYQGGFFSKTLSDEDVEEYTQQLCSESYLAFLNILFPRIKMNHHLKVPILVIGAKNDIIFLEKKSEIRLKNTRPSL